MKQINIRKELTIIGKLTLYANFVKGLRTEFMEDN